MVATRSPLFPAFPKISCILCTKPAREVRLLKPALRSVCIPSQAETPNYYYVCLVQVWDNNLRSQDCFSISLESGKVHVCDVVHLLGISSNREKHFCSVYELSNSLQSMLTVEAEQTRRFYQKWLQISPRLSLCFRPLRGTRKGTLTCSSIFVLRAFNFR